MNNLFPQLPVAELVENMTSWLTTNLSGFFNFIQTSGQMVMDGMTQTLLSIPAYVFMIIIPLIMYFISNRKIGMSIFALLGLMFVYNQGLWAYMMATLTLVIIASLISIIIGIPLGILMSKSNRAESIIQPLLDFMQTMPSFVYLIPAVAFFGIGMVPGVFASVIFALPPTVRMTNLGIRQVSGELTEAADSFGATGWQKLTALELPMAKDTIFSGINQTTMLALSMVVTASMIGAPGLGEGVLTALQRAQVGNGFVNGISLVILAIIIDRITQNLNVRNILLSRQSPFNAKLRRFGLLALSVLGLGIIGGTAYQMASGQDETLTLASMQWDSEIASANVMKIILEDAGYNVQISDLDPAIMFSSIATGDADATIAPWLPVTQGHLYERFKEDIVDLGPNLVGAQNGLTVPAYMDVDSIEDLTNEANQVITGIEPGAGITSAAENTLEAYPNLANWELSTSSTGAMTVELGQAIENQEEIIITGWAPHWMFNVYDLKMLDDPQGTMGESEEIRTIVRQGLEEDHPEAYYILDNFKWTLDDMAEVMLEMENGTPPEIAAQNWIDANPELVESYYP